ncbi:hypothetical protein CDL12_20425 [Handroanthus impetiginosus]|uniref:Uncharacterized protein n=1 Tax=Handroanthus impetiginosus TaxID=429701 RepID=A0A2G9GP15_9LAMI|nr:hypothetical protein CDL12_20425 [Handroanthus impetiginosus]
MITALKAGLFCLHILSRCRDGMHSYRLLICLTRLKASLLMTAAF